MEAVRRTLNLLSVGEYNHGLFFQGRQLYSTTISGLITVLLVLAAVSYSFVIFFNVMKGEDYIVSTSVEDLGKRLW